MRVPPILILLALCAGCTQVGCLDCDDGNPCTFDSCVEGACLNKVLSGPVEGCSGRGGCVEYMCFKGECLLQRVLGCCGNGVCEGGEEYPTCPGDCGATCADGLLNQGEDEVDCGGPCTPCESPDYNYLRRLNDIRGVFLASAGNYTLAIQDYNLGQDKTPLGQAALRSYGEVERARELLMNITTPEDLFKLQFLMDEAMSVYLKALREMVLYSETGEDVYRVSSNKLFADSLDKDRAFIGFYNSAVDRYYVVSRGCFNHVFDEWEESVDCGGRCKKPCELILNVTKHLILRSEGGSAVLTVNVSSPAIHYPPQQRLIRSYQSPEPDAIYKSEEGNLYYVYELNMPAYGVREIKLSELVRLYPPPPPAISNSKYFNSIYLIGDNFSQTTDDICFRASMLKGNSTKTADIVSRILDWLRENIEYEYNDEEHGAQYCHVHRRGACDEHADLFIAMARCVGIPARRVTGSLLNASELRGHAWSEYYDGGWVYIDPSTKKPNQPHALDNRHVAACVGEGAYNCGVGYTYTYRRKKPRVTVEERIYLS
jgi:hypothetical protein